MKSDDDRREAEATARALVEECKQVVCYWGTGCGEGTRCCSGCSALNQSRERLTTALAAITQERDEALAARVVMEREQMKASAQRDEARNALAASRTPSINHLLARNTYLEEELRRMAASRAEGEGRVSMLHAALAATLSLVDDVTPALEHTRAEICRTARQALTTTGAAAQVHDAAVAQGEAEAIVALVRPLISSVADKKAVTRAIRVRHQGDLRDDGPEEG